MPAGRRAAGEWAPRHLASDKRLAADNLAGGDLLIVVVQSMPKNRRRRRFLGGHIVTYIERSSGRLDGTCGLMGTASCIALFADQIRQPIFQTAFDA